MSRYRYALQCPYCKKVYADDRYNAVHDLSRHCTSLCPKCGEVSGAFDRVVAKPKLFGLLGWEVKEEEEMIDKEQEYDCLDIDASRKAFKRMKREEREKRILKATPLIVAVLWASVALSQFITGKEIEGLICIVISTLWSLMNIVICKK